ncbi:acyl-CoA dehydrogenase family protein [Pseudoalteromonas sp. MMG013]|uniref:acyl-CoA dehydrogenase family protein n=1 Tax=Pseudoalteromonas sp. MMG013 TaxID=2822687 RepID=UPI001B359D59|nr:acyl-CoA dehydrogenase family protein [Pseudoalteromonas sp. MMG013]MBQ4861091.1 acyl-CoA dehydrogenase family protein [Pseudoalteromonas sp. MMG013]
MSKNGFSLKSASDVLKQFCQQAVKQNIALRDQQQYLDEEIKQSLIDAGLMGIEINRDYFQRSDKALFDDALPFSGAVLMIQEVSKVDPGVAVFLHVHNILFNKILQQFGSDSQKSQWLPKVATGAVGAFAVTEPQAGSDLSLMETSAKRIDAGYEINGVKTWITNAGEAQVMLLIANTELECGRKVPSAFLVDTALPGISISQNIPKMSVRASSTCRVTMDQVFVPESALVGAQNQGIDIANYGLCMGRIGIAAQMLGISEGALSLAVEYANERVAFKHKTSEFQGVSFPLAQVCAEVSVLKPFIYQLAKKAELGHSSTQLLDEANKAKLVASQLADRATSAALETLGGNGVALDYDVEKLFRDAKVGKIYEGTVNILLRSIASRMFNC